jgi:hypothetical protein
MFMHWVLALAHPLEVGRAAAVAFGLRLALFDNRGLRGGNLAFDNIAYGANLDSVDFQNSS